jgi:hypothetical protein
MGQTLLRSNWVGQLVVDPYTEDKGVIKDAEIWYIETLDDIKTYVDRPSPTYEIWLTVLWSDGVSSRCQVGEIRVLSNEH